MSVRAFAAWCLREAATRISAIEHPDPRGAASLASSARQLRVTAAILDPATATCVVCNAALSASMCPRHVCPPEALSEWNSRRYET